MFSAATKTGTAGGYQISRSLRFNSADSAYLTRTFSSAGNRRTWTWSAWVKQSEVDGFRNMFTSNIFSAATDSMTIRLYQNVFVLQLFNNGSGIAAISTNAAIRDYSAWYHFVCAVDTTQATDSNRVKLYINGVQQTVTGTYPAQNYEYPIGSTSWANAIGAWNNGTFGMNGYMTEMYFIDGQALTPSSFGETNAQTGVWQPKAYSGSYGTNGFYLNFSDNSNTTAATLGKDYSGNGNNWTPNNFSVSAGSGNDSLVDVPTPYGVDTGAGGTVRGNYCTLNPLITPASTTLVDGNLSMSGYTPFSSATGSIGVSSGKWYFEFIAQADAMSGITGTPNGSFYPGQASNAYAWDSANSNKYNNNTSASYGSATSAGDIVGVAFDLDSGSITFYKNNVSQGTAYTFTPSGIYFPVVRNGSSTNTSVNFGQRAFAYTAPSGFKALCTQNLPTPTIGATTATQANKYFDVVLRNGGGSSGGTYSTTVNMSNGALLWDKPRNSASSNYLVDSVRGISKTLKSNDTSAEVTDASWFTNFGNGLFTTGSSDWSTTTTVVDWIWAANGSGASNTAGSITSTVSANTTSGFSIVTYTGNGANATVGHGLGVAPSMIIVKSRSAGSTDWRVFASVLNDNSKWLALNTTAAATTESGYWNTGVSSTVFGIGPYSYINDSGSTYVAYCFAAISGYSAFGSYTGNGSTDGPFVFTGFRPAFILLKSSSGSTTDWIILDSERDPNNVANDILRPNLSDAELVDVYSNTDFVSNGFKVRGQGTFGFNISGTTYIYAAFAESPFKYSLAR